MEPCDKAAVRPFKAGEDLEQHGPFDYALLCQHIRYLGGGGVFGYLYIHLFIHAVKPQKLLCDDYDPRRTQCRHGDDQCHHYKGKDDTACPAPFFAFPAAAAVFLLVIILFIVLAALIIFVVFFLIVLIIRSLLYLLLRDVYLSGELLGSGNGISAILHL